MMTGGEVEPFPLPHTDIRSKNESKLESKLLTHKTVEYKINSRVDKG